MKDGKRTKNEDNIIIMWACGTANNCWWANIISCGNGKEPHGKRRRGKQPHGPAPLTTPARVAEMNDQNINGLRNVIK